MGKAAAAVRNCAGKGKGLVSSRLGSKKVGKYQQLGSATEDAEQTRWANIGSSSHEGGALSSVWTQTAYIEEPEGGAYL